MQLGRLQSNLLDDILVAALPSPMMSQEKRSKRIKNKTSEQDKCAPACDKKARGQGPAAQQISDDEYVLQLLEISAELRDADGDLHCLRIELLEGDLHHLPRPSSNKSLSL